MKLDENVCRGSLIFHKGERYVVVGPGVHVSTTAGKFGGQHRQQRFGWRIIPVSDLELLEIRMEWITTIDKEEDVEVFFPGVAYQLPDYIR